MTLRTKTISIISPVLGAVIVVLFLITRGILHGGFNKVENDLITRIDTIETEDAHQDVQRVTDALQFTIDNLATKAADWAMWDDTYRFILDKNKAYVRSNLSKDALSALKINMILMLNSTGDIVVGMAFDPEKNDVVPLPKGMEKYLKSGSFLLKHVSTQSMISGILMLPENPLMIVSRPILKSDGTGPIRGTFMFAQYLGADELSRLASMTHLKIGVYRIDKDELPADFLSLKSAAPQPNSIIVSKPAGDSIVGYTEVRDLENHEALLVRVDTSRPIHKQGLLTLAAIRTHGRVTLLSIIVSIVATGLALGFAILFILEFSILSRLGRLTKTTVKIGSSNDFSGRVSIEGTDEIASLGISINATLAALDSTHKEIEMKSAELRLLMNTVPAGLLSIDERLVVNPEYSRAAETILGERELAGKSFLDLLGLTHNRMAEREKLREFLDFFKQALLPEKDTAALNPFEELRYEKNGDTKWLRLRYFTIDRLGKPNHLLAAIEDITEEKKLSLEVTRSQRENFQLKAIAENPDLFREFLAETRRIIESVTKTARKFDTKETSLPLVHEIFRGVHTIKGVAGSFGLFDLTEASSKLEDMLYRLRDHAFLTPEAIDAIVVECNRLSVIFSEIIESAKRILGDDIEREIGVYLRIPLSELKRHIMEIKEMGIDDSLKSKMIDEIKTEILRRFRSLLKVPAKKGFARAVKIVPGLIRRLDKNARFNFEGQETLVDCETAIELTTPLIHLLRNAFDHGIEPPSLRIENGKTEQGTVTLSVDAVDGHVVISLSDDGRGLDAELLKSAACKKGVITPEESSQLTEEDAFALILRPGFSTAETISDVSGRGVGMDAVITSVKHRLGGQLRIESEKGKGSSFIISVPV